LCGWKRFSSDFFVFFVLLLDKVAFGGSVAARRLAVVLVILVDGILFHGIPSLSHFEYPLIGLL
jgi:hypothetical protein